MKTVFFTGATGGLGEPCVEALSRTGRWTVFAAGTNAAALDRLGALPNVIALEVDVTSQESVERAHGLVRGRTAALDAVVNFAGMTSFASLVEGDCVRDVERLLAVNVVGTARVNRVFFDMVREGRGRIVNCSSESGWMTPTPFAGPYVLSKYAIEGYNDSLRRELMFLGIPVVKLQPGSFQTRITRQVLEGFERTLATTRYYGDLLRRLRPLMTMELGRRSDIARLVRTVLQALESRRPRLSYKVGTGRLLALLELFPERCVDWIYRVAAGAAGRGPR
jgi:NAD(P)-dependent dehydrogenase (short-subunit alcohol dehydrogenase family)